MDTDPDLDKKDVRRPMNAFLIFCKRHRSMVRDKNPHLDNRSVTRILGDLWANIGEEEKIQYTDLAKQYKDAFMKANPDYKWHNPERVTPLPHTKLNNRPTNERVPSVTTFVSEGGPIVPGKLADPSNMGGLSMLMEGIKVKSNQFVTCKDQKPAASTFLPPPPSLYPWITQQDLEEEKKLVIDEGLVPVKRENIEDIMRNSVPIKQEQREQQMLTGTHDQKEEEPVDPDEAIYSCGKIVMDHIIDKLYLSTFKNMAHNKSMPAPSTAMKKSPQPGTQEVKPPSTSSLPPPLQGKKSYHTSIAVKNLLEFTRRAAARDEANNNNRELGQPQSAQQIVNKNIVSEAKQKLKDFCLKKEGRPKVISGNENSGDGFDIKEFKRKRCYSESCAELYKCQEKRIKLESDQCENSGDRKSSSPNDDDYQPTRKSRRRNRGQRYQELINEGIIQPSKARLAAMKTDTNIKNISFRETFFSKKTDDLGDEVLSVYPRQIRKRTMSESEKNRTSFVDSSRYRTGDFDLEAQIKTLPACSLEKVVRPKRSVGKSFSESDTGNTEFIGAQSESSEVIPEVKLTVPPHLKAKPSNSNVPVVGSRKRKARKHSITHLMPVKNDQKSDVPSILTGSIGEKILTKSEKFLNKGESEQCGHEKSDMQTKDKEVSSYKTNYKLNIQIESINNSSEQSATEGDDNLNTNMYEAQILDLSNRGNSVEESEREAQILDLSNRENTVNQSKSETPYSHQIDNINRDTSGHTQDIKYVEESLNRQYFTKLKSSCEDVKNSEFSDADNKSISFDIAASKGGMDIQDENSNDTRFCNNSKDTSENNDENNELSNDSTDNCDMCDGRDNVTMVTAVSVSVPLATDDIHHDNRKNTTDLQINVSQVSQCDTSSVSMTTIQTSLTCTC